ncbi:Os09g0278501 [Oryza sativa Japonica Group]|jgi:hypothetical protein|uniref:Os09g0278501 protein n=1 Tax=Oryza sativa subsp. japonica TaxID=39947 RepID=A0A0P0XKZ8_ORYSJ|nr:Os09g0278501 [Oryza sativa Japonica Group]
MVLLELVHGRKNRSEHVSDGVGAATGDDSNSSNGTTGSSSRGARSDYSVMASISARDDEAEDGEHLSEPHHVEWRRRPDLFPPPPHQVHQQRREQRREYQVRVPMGKQIKICIDLTTHKLIPLFTNQPK